MQRQTEKQSSRRKTTTLLSFSFTDREMIFWQEHYYWDDATYTRDILEFEILLSLTFFSFKVWPGQISFTDMCLLNFVNNINNSNNNCFKMMMMSALILSLQLSWNFIASRTLTSFQLQKIFYALEPLWYCLKRNPNFETVVWQK